MNFNEMDVNEAHINIEVEDGRMQWITCDTGKNYSGFWQEAESPLTEEEINQILAILEKHTPNPYFW